MTSKPDTRSSWMRRSTDSSEKPTMKRIHTELYLVVRTNRRA